MPGNVARKATKGSDLTEYGRSIALFLRRRIWLPELLYAAVPYFYMLSGLIAFLATIYVPDWFWVVPHYVLFSGVCIHIGILIYRRRHRKPDAVLLDADPTDPPDTS